MAAPTAGNQKLYVMQISMSSPFFIRQSEIYESENAKKMYYKFTSENRKKIQAIRQQINVIKDAGCAKFYGLAIANDLSKEQITEALLKADAQMKEIDPTLHADAQFLPLQSEAFTSGTLLDNLTSQIREQIHGVVLRRIEKTIEDNENNGMLSAKTKAALLKMLEKCKAVNVIGDEAINTRIEAMKDQINNDQILTMREEILSLLDDTKGRFASIDMIGMGANPALAPIEDTEVKPDDVYIRDKTDDDDKFDMVVKPRKASTGTASRFAMTD